MITSVDPCLFLADLDEEDTLVDVQCWNLASNLPSAAEDDFDTPVVAAHSLLPNAEHARRVHADGRVLRSFPVCRDPLKPPK